MASVRVGSSRLDAGHRTAPGFTSEFAELLRTLRSLAADSYRPELHYMRGPGPKWHAKHDPAPTTGASHSVTGLMRANA